MSHIINRTTLLALVLPGTLLMGGCDSDNDHQPAPSKTVVLAAQGGQFTDGAAEPGITVSIPPAALDSDAELVIEKIAGDSNAFHVSLKKPDGGEPALSSAIKITLRSEAAPVHPQLAEITAEDGGNSQPLPSFYRPDSQTVIALSNDPDSTYRVQFRHLKAVSGEAVGRGRKVLMSETFGNENFFGGVLGLHTLLKKVDPATAVSLGVQVDLTKTPQAIIDVMTGDDLAAKDAALKDPATTLALLEADAVIGVRAQFDASGNMTSAGITCALCHVTVEPTEFQLGSGPVKLPIGKPRFDGVPNTKMNAGAIIAATPFVQGLDDDGATAAVLNGWGPGNFDIRALPDNVLDDGVDNPTNYPPIWNFVDLSEQGYTYGWDGLFKDNGSDNNALASQAEAVYDLVMHANGAFGTAAGTLPPELSITPPQSLLDALAQAETAQPGNDVTLNKLLDLQAFMRSITSPAPAAFDVASAERGFELFHGKANCGSCHSSPDLTGPGLFTAITAPQGGLAGGIHIPSLRGIGSTAPYFSDGSAATLNDAVATIAEKIDQVPALTIGEQNDLVEYLKSL